MYCFDGAYVARSRLCIWQAPPFTENDVADCIQKNELDFCISKCEQMYLPSQTLFDNCYYWTVNQALLKYGENETMISKVSPLCEKIVSPGGFSPTKQNCYDRLTYGPIANNDS